MFENLKVMMDNYPWWLFWFTFVLMVIAGCLGNWTPFYRNMEVNVNSETKDKEESEKI